MANPQGTYSTLEDLEKDPTKQHIVVRLIRKWEARNRRRGSRLLSQELLFLDETGRLIKASINHRLINYYRTIFREGSIYHISKFVVEENNGLFKLSDHKYSLQFNHLTVASEVLDDQPGIERTKFRVHDYEKLLLLANTNQVLSDVVGRIVFVWGTKLRYIGSKNKIMARIVLKDGTKVRLSVWDKIASDFRSFLSMTQRKQCSVLITAVNPKLFSGDLYLNTSPATRFYEHDDPENLLTISHLSDGIKSCSLEEHEMNEDSSIKTISQILSFLDVAEPQEKDFLCSARIVDIITRNGWCNISCAQCYNRIKPVDAKMICRNCDKSDFIGVVRFRLEVIVDDETDQGRFVIFDREARKLTNMLAEDLVTFEGSTPSYANQKELPSCLQKLIGEKYIFKLSLTKFDFKAKDKTFSVAGIVNGPINRPSRLPNRKRVHLECKDTDNTFDHKGKKVKLDEIDVEGSSQQSRRCKRSKKK